MYNESGFENGHCWSITYIGGKNNRTFEIKVGEIVDHYEAVYPLTFGMDWVDSVNINSMLDAMYVAIQEEIE